MRTVLAALSILIGAALVAPAQSPSIQQTGEMTPYFYETGVQGNASDNFEVVAAQLIAIEDATALRLHYSDARLSGASFVRVTSLLDGDVQELNAAELTEWSNTSAHFNGDTVLFELVAAPHTQNNFVVMEQIGVEHAVDAAAGGPGPCGICNTDDRSLSYEDFAGRLYWTQGSFEYICSASVYTTNSCIVSAGHCDGTTMKIEFQVPQSFSNCAYKHPSAIHQYPITGRNAANGGAGNDWAVLTSGASQGLRAFQRYGELRRFPSVAAPTANSSIYGYGVDNTCVRSGVQQFSAGQITGLAGYEIRFNNDIQGGSSGSSILINNLIYGIATHCYQTNCLNGGTYHTRPTFAQARANFCVPCQGDLDGDGDADQSDLGVLLAAYGTCFGDALFSPVADITGDSCVGQQDLGIILAAYGTDCP